jgi:hypothetical protein
LDGSGDEIGTVDGSTVNGSRKVTLGARAVISFQLPSTSAFGREVTTGPDRPAGTEALRISILSLGQIRRDLDAVREAGCTS